jgi:hypothetical protein
VLAAASDAKAKPVDVSFPSELQVHETTVYLTPTV